MRDLCISSGQLSRSIPHATWDQLPRWEQVENLLHWFHNHEAPEPEGRAKPPRQGLEANPRVSFQDDESAKFWNAS